MLHLKIFLKLSQRRLLAPQPLHLLEIVAIFNPKACAIILLSSWLLYKYEQETDQNKHALYKNPVHHT